MGEMLYQIVVKLYIIPVDCFDQRWTTWAPNRSLCDDGRLEVYHVACFLPDYPKLRNFVRKMGENHGRFVQNPTFFEKEKCLKSDFQGVSLKFRHVSNQIPRILN